MVRCIDCGYLAARNADTRQLEEVERGHSDTVHEVFKQCGRLEHEFSGLGERHNAPICFVGHLDLWEEYREATPTATQITELSDSSIVRVLTEERGCPVFADYQQGFTPKEHREMMDRQWMQKHQEEREDADKKWREKQGRNLVIYAGMFTVLGAVIGAVIVILAN